MDLSLSSEMLKNLPSPITEDLPFIKEATDYTLLQSDVPKIHQPLFHGKSYLEGLLSPPSVYKKIDGEVQKVAGEGAPFPDWWKNFEQGGLVPKYYGGGSVKGNPTIADYFGEKGMTLGGSNKQSVAEMLGMRR